MVARKGASDIKHHAPLWANLLFFDAQQPGLPWSNEAFQVLSGVPAGGLADPTWKIHNQPVLTDAERLSITNLYASIRQRGVYVIRQEPADSIAGLSDFCKIANKHLGKTVRPALVAAMYNAQSSYGHVLRQNTERLAKGYPKLTPAAQHPFILPAFTKVLFDDSLIPNPESTQGIFEIYYRIFDSGRRGHSDLQK